VEKWTSIRTPFKVATVVLGIAVCVKQTDSAKCVSPCQPFSIHSAADLSPVQAVKTTFSHNREQTNLPTQHSTKQLKATEGNRFS
jgi:hypothetical protein